MGFHSSRYNNYSSANVHCEKNVLQLSRRKTGNFQKKNENVEKTLVENIPQREKDRMEMHMMQQNQMNSLMQREQYMGPPYAHNGSMKCKLACGQ